MDLAYPAGLAAEAVQVVQACRAAPAWPRRARPGPRLAARLWPRPARWCWPKAIRAPPNLSFGLALRAYDFSPHKTGDHKPLRARWR